MAYGSDIDAILSPQHRWNFDGDASDNVGSADGTNSGMSTGGTAICKDVTNSFLSSSTSDRVTIPNTSDINSSAQTRKAVGGWFMFTANQGPPKRIYGEGNQSTNFQFVAFVGNYVMFEVLEPTNFNIQIYGPFLEPNRVYHLLGSFSGSGFDNEVKFFVDGIEMTDANPTDRQPDTADLNSRSPVEFGDPAGTVGIGGGTVILNAPVNGNYNEWCTWNGVTLSDSSIRVDLFEKGALGDVVISSGTESAMQTSLDVYANSTRSNAACCIEIQAVTGDGDLSLDLDNITFNDLASIHVKYLGTGTLTLVNKNGSNAIQAKCSAPWGTIIVSTEVVININVKDLSDFTAIENARVYIKSDSGGDLPADTLILNSLTNSSGDVSTLFNYTSEQPIIGYVRKATSSPFYSQASISGPITNSGLRETILMIPDE